MMRQPPVDASCTNIDINFKSYSNSIEECPDCFDRQVYIYMRGTLKYINSMFSITVFPIVSL